MPIVRVRWTDDKRDHVTYIDKRLYFIIFLSQDFIASGLLTPVEIFPIDVITLSSKLLSFFFHFQSFYLIRRKKRYLN